jgi:2'-5' RNA ligase
MLSNAIRENQSGWPMHFVLCYPKLSPADGEAIEAFRRAHEPARAKMVRAHVTLVFGVTSLPAGALAAHAAAVARTSAPFDFAFDGIEVGAHETGDHNLFLKVGEGSDRLIALHQALYAGPLSRERRDDMAFAPHMTIATNADLKTVITAAMSAKPLSATKGRIDALEIVTLSGDSLHKVASAPLTGAT